MRGLGNALKLSIALFTVVACSSAAEPSSQSSASSTKRKSGKTTTPLAGGTKEAENNPFEPDDPSGKPVASPNGWCAAAGKTQIVKSPEHADQFAQLCTAKGTATQRFVDLLSSPFTGSGEPSPTELIPTATGGGQVKAFLATAIRLPITAEKNFSSIAPKEGDVALQKEMAKFQGQTPGNIAVTALPQSSDFGWERGWKVDKDGSQKVQIVTIQTKYSEKNEHYDLDGGHYMYVSTMASPADQNKTIRDYRILNAMIDINGKAHIVSIVNVAADDRGMPDAATSSVKNAVISTMKYHYNAAAAAK